MISQVWVLKGMHYWFFNKNTFESVENTSITSREANRRKNSQPSTVNILPHTEKCRLFWHSHFKHYSSFGKFCALTVPMGFFVRKAITCAQCDVYTRPGVTSLADHAKYHLVSTRNCEYWFKNNWPCQMDAETCYCCSLSLHVEMHAPTVLTYMQEIWMQIK